MAIAQDNILEDVKLDLVARLEADAFFSDVHVLYQNEGDLDTDRKNALAGRTSKSGRKGAAVIIHSVDVAEVSGQGPVPQMKLSALIECAETRKLNHSAAGTGKTAAEISARVVQLLNHYTPHHLCLGSWHLPSAPVQELSLLDGMVGFAVELNNHAHFQAVPKVATPEAAAGGTSLTLACATAGAAIHYTTDGSYPSSANRAALYSSPITVAPGDEITFIARLADHNDSDTMRAIIS